MSKNFSLNKEDILKIIKGLCIAMAGAGVTYILGILDAIDISAYDPLIVALVSATINALRIFIREKTENK